MQVLMFELNKPFMHQIGGDPITNVLTTVSWENNELLQIDKFDGGQELRRKYRVNEKGQLEIEVENSYSCCHGTTNEVHIYRRV